MDAQLPEIVGLLLAGGQARRMGGQAKHLLALRGRPLLAYAMERARPQVGPLLLNGPDSGGLSDFGLPIVADAVPGQAGPLAGILTGMEWALQHAPQCQWVASFATDTPFFPVDLVQRLQAARMAENADFARAASAGRPQPVFGLWPVARAAELRRAITEENTRKITTWTARYRMAEVDFPTAPMDPFFNVNQLEDLTRLEALLEKTGKETPA